MEIKPDFSTANRNLALAYVNIMGDKSKGLSYLEKAFTYNQEDARVLFELDQLYKKLGTAFEHRLDILRSNISLVHDRDDLFVEYLTLLNHVGKYQKAKDLIDHRIFHPWEGGEGKVVAQYKACRVGLASKALKEHRYEEGINNLLECEYYPHNLGEGKLQGSGENDIHYLLGVAYEALGDISKSEEYYQSSSIGIEEPSDAMFYNDQPADMMFYRGLALRKLGFEELALSCFNKIYDYGEKHIYDEVSIDYFAVSLPDFLVFDEDLNEKNKVHCLYLLGLGKLGLGDRDCGMAYLMKAKEINKNHQGIIKCLTLMEFI